MKFILNERHGRKIGGTEKLLDKKKAQNSNVNNMWFRSSALIGYNLLSHSCAFYDICGDT